MTSSPSTASCPARIVCVTPIRNEEWILERFLTATEQWADHIVIADQGSTDRSREIAQACEKVRLIENRAPAYDEGARQQLLLAAAREIPGPRVIVALDADELLSPTWQDSAEWAALRSAPSGTVFRFDWINLLPDHRAFVPREKFPFAFVDDGSEHGGESIHSTRIPVQPAAPVIDMTTISVLHLQHTDWSRMKSKQRWYQCWERLNNPSKRAIQIYRQYHWMDALPLEEVRPLDAAWIDSYRQLGISLTASRKGGPYWWDREVITWFLEEGTHRFSKLDLWELDWAGVAAELGLEADSARLRDPRSRIEKSMHTWLRRTQRVSARQHVRWCQRALIPFGW